MHLIKRFMRESDGVTALEYALIAALIAVTIIGSLQLLGADLSAKFDFIAGVIGGAGGGS